jgi:hypothetical protein
LRYVGKVPEGATKKKELMKRGSHRRKEACSQIALREKERERERE